MFDSGTLTLATAKVLSKYLQDVGAQVVITRHEVGKLLSVPSFDQWLKENDTLQLKFKHIFETLGRWVSHAFYHHPVDPLSPMNPSCSQKKCCKIPRIG